MREDLFQRYDFNLADAFCLIHANRSCEQPIDFDMLSRFIAKNGESMSADDILAILRRYDADMDAKLSFKEFINIYSTRS